MPPVTRTSLIEARKHRQWSQQELAELLGTTQNNISRWERGITTPGPYFRRKLCTLLGKTLQELGLSDEPAAGQPNRPTPDIPNVSLPPLEQEAPLWYVPSPRNPFFTGREELLHHLYESLHRKHRMALTQSLAISGLGGIGKTQIALEYAYHYRASYQAVFWLSAATRETLLAGFVTLAQLLQLPEKDARDHHRVLSAVKGWFATHQHWLLILDNADDVSVLHNLLPTEQTGHLLITTRAQALGSLAQRIDVETMGMAEATWFLLRRAKRLAPDAFLDQVAQAELAAAEAIAIEMGFLPLALDQAGAYIEEVGCSLASYLDLYRTHRQKILSRRGHMSTDHPEPVTTTWSLNFQHIEQANPAAADLLRLCAFLEPDAIPEEWFTEGSACLGPVLQPIAADALALNDAMEELRKFSLLHRNPETRLLRVHRLVQAVLKDTMEEEEQRRWAERAIRATHVVFPETVHASTWARCQRYLAQAQTCTLLARDYTITSGEVASLLFRIASYLYDHALYEQAEPLFLQALHMQEQVCGVDHLDVARPLYGLAVLYSQQKKYAAAEPLFQRALSIRQRNLGPNHPDVAKLVERFADSYAMQGKYQEAEALYQQVIRIWEKALGQDHPDMASALDGLGATFARQAKYAEAEPLFQRALSMRERLLGPNHPDIAASLNNMATFYLEQGKYELAEQLGQRAVHIWEQALGVDHHYLAYPLDALAEVCEAQNRYEEATLLFQRAAHIREQALGPEHPDVAYDLNGLANIYSRQGRYEEAEPLFQRAIRMYEQAFGECHPDIAKVCYDFAVCQQARGKSQEAVALYQRALAIREQTLGADHPETVETREKYLALTHTINQEEAVVSIETAQVENM